MQIKESGENYLETILVIQKRNGMARSIDIANELNFSRASVSRAMSLLKTAGHIEIKNIHEIVLTDSGRKIAEAIYEKHCTIKDFLIHIGVNQETASEEACKIEHILSTDSFDKLKNHLEKEKAQKNSII
ncbi:MAG: metal-dependent transcriptional regulator [bacterium]